MVKHTSNSEGWSAGLLGNKAIEGGLIVRHVVRDCATVKRNPALGAAFLVNLDVIFVATNMATES